MSRRRYISTEMGLDPKLKKLAQDCGPLAVLMYTWLIPHAEDDGIIKGSAEVILGRVMPTWRWVEVEDAEAALEAMHRLELIHWDGSMVAFPVEKFYAYQPYIKAERRRSEKFSEVPRSSTQISASHSHSHSHSLSHPHPDPHSHSHSDGVGGGEPPPSVLITDGWEDVIKFWADVSHQVETNLKPKDVTTAKQMVAVTGGDLPCIYRAINKTIEKQGDVKKVLAYYMNMVAEEAALRDAEAAGVTYSQIDVTKKLVRAQRQSKVPGSNRRVEDAKYYADYAKLEEQLLNAEDDDERGSA